MRILQPHGWPRPRGYSNGIEAEGKVVFVAGQIGWDESGKVQATFADQFVPFAQIVLDMDQLLMVPTRKVIPTEAGPSTWGRLKAQYR